MKKTTLTLFAITMFLGSVSYALAASDINYGSIREATEDTLLVQFRSPGGNQYYSCTTEGECSTNTSESPTLYPTINGQSNYTKSSQGTYGIATTPVPILSIVNYILYRTTGSDSQFVSLLPFNRAATDIRFSRNENRIIFRESSGMVTTYDIDSRKAYTISTGVTSFPYWSISPDGSKASAYNRTLGGYTVWDLETGAIVSISDAQEGVLEFSEDGTYGAYTVTHNGYVSLVTLDFTETSLSPHILTSDSTVVDYIFVGDTLFYASNTQNSPYEWNLYTYDFDTNKTEKIADNFSYGEYMKAIGDNIVFIQMQSPNAIPVLYNIEDEKLIELDPFNNTETFENIEQKVINEDGIYGVVWAPRSEKSDTLLVWLHGGPQRQTSAGYHPYFSYGVYDDILRRFVDAGVTVVRIDYTGSWGYGESFIKALNANLGKTDVENVFTLINEARTSRTKDIYLAGNSYGGYLALRTLVEQPSEFEGAISINGVTDWQSLITRIPSSPFASYFGGIPHVGNQELYNQASVVNRLNGIDNEDILLVYGEQDSTVPTWQTTEFYTALQNSNKDAQLIRFPEEEHVIVKAQSLETLCKEMSKVVDKKISCSF